MVKALQIPNGRALEDNSQYTNRFEIASESSNRVYIVAQNKSTGEWSCSCPGWIIKKSGKERTCKHLKTLAPLLQNAQNAAPKRVEAPAPTAMESMLQMAEPKKKSRKIQA